ncbi:hypothetical protein Ctha_2092 [Chloroherpeton thalassium ATCC 35110]|uniref:Uncharacterized protein n=1 Tax=Chloroherpeton thalassium (strain ATCC 35110 / GB-78) TaxID=517418 RepID=B3QVE4_CHLT3|nr:hypothetical protein [Chloroherpeton thalassium]ACF14544.1 hypothetical protein Ctha_2092 [Chloroherpeton thalassium ATCC 35110]
MTLFDYTISEYESEDEDKQVKTVYACFGSAVYHAQVLEKEYQLMLIRSRLIKRKPKSRVEHEKIIDKIEKSINTI